MTLPTLTASYYVASSTTDRSTLATASFTPAVGEVIVVKATTQDFPQFAASCVGGTSPWTAQGVSQSTPGACNVTVWTTVVTTSAAMTVAVGFAGGLDWHAIVVERWINAQLAPSPAVGVTPISTSCTGSFTTDYAGSIVTWVAADWAGVNPATPTYRSSATAVHAPFYVSGQITAYFGYQAAATAGVQTFGVSAPTGQSSTMIGVELVASGVAVPTLGAAILKGSASGVRVAVEVAWGASLADLTGSTWNWVDITSDVFIQPGGNAGVGCLTIQLGSPDESPGQQTQASQFTCTLDNRASKYSLGGQSPNWPNVVRNTPVRVRASTDGGSNWTVKYQGNAVSWQPAWDEAGKFATVLLTASGPLRQLNQGTLLATSAYKQWILANADSHLIGYWPLEDGTYAKLAPSAIGGTAASVQPYGTNKAVVTGVANASGDLFACSGTMASSGGFICPIPSYTNSGAQQALWLFDETAEATTSTADPYAGMLYPATGTIKCWAIIMSPGGYWGLQAFTAAPAPGTSPASGTKFYDSGTFGFNLLNNSYLVSLTLTTSGANVVYLLETLSTSGEYHSITNTVTGCSSGAIGTVWGVSPPSLSDGSAASALGHIILRNSSVPLSTYNTALTAYNGEALLARIVRLATRANIPLTVKTTSATETSVNPLDTLGQQFPDTVTNLLRECEATGFGVLHDGLGAGLTYASRTLRESQQPAMILDASAGDLAVQFAPIDDDQLTINDVTVTRRNGSSALYQDINGPLGINAVGDYQTSVTVNPSVDSALSLYAQWLVHLGTIPGYRYPAITFALDRIPSKIASWLTMIPTSRFDIVNISSLRSQMPSDTIRNVLNGWTETIDLFSWHVTANCTNWEAWNVATMAAATGTTVDTVARRDTDGSAVATAVSAGATSVSVALTATGKPLWVTGSGDDFPMVVSMGGVPVTVTAISGSSSPQTFTVPAGVPIPLIVGDAVQLWNPPRLGM